jgi:RNA polymerase sigma-70 factor (ECF subfamily)
MTTVGMSLPSAQGCNVPVVYFQRQDGRTLSSHRRRLTEADQTRAIEMRRSGASFKNIGIELGVCEATAKATTKGVAYRKPSALMHAPIDVPEEFKAALVAKIPVIRRYARSLAPDHDRADDLVQEVMLHAMAYHDRYTTHTNFEGWLIRIARNAYLEGLRKVKRLVEDPDNIHATLSPVEGNQESALDLAVVTAAIDRLPAQQAKTIRLAVFEDLTYDQIAVVLGCAVGTVKSRVNRAREGLLLELEGRPIRPQPESHHVE